MSSTVILERATRGVAELHRNRFEIILDDKSAGSIDRNQTTELAVPSGLHTLQVKAGRYSSPAQSFDAQDGTDTHFVCNGAILWPRYVASLVVPALGLKLKRV